MLTTLVYRDHRLAAENPPPETLADLRATPGVMLWVDLADPTADEIALVLERTFAFHPLAIEDCVADQPPPKLEDYEDHLHLVMPVVNYGPGGKFGTSDFHLFLGRDFLVTYHRQPLRPIDLTHERCRRTPGVAVRGPDRFAHTILDHLVEGLPPTLEPLRHELASIEEGVLKGLPTAEIFPRVAALRRELANLRQILRPQREVATLLATGKHRVIRAVLAPYLRDLAEEIARLEHQVGVWADQLILTFRVYLNRSSFEASQGIRALTALTALTIPLFLVGGWYGMNFARMPETDSPLGYAAASLLTVLTTLGMLFYLRRRRWL